MSQLVSSSESIFVHDYASSQHKLKVKNPHLYGKINDVTWSHNNHVLATAGDDGRVVLMKSDNGVEITRYEMTKGFGLNSLCFSNSSHYLIGGSSDSTVRVFDLKNKSMYKTFTDHSSEVLSVSCNNKEDNLRICSSATDGMIYINSLEDSKALANFQLNDSSCRVSKFSPMKSSEFGSGHNDGIIAIWD